MRPRQLLRHLPAPTIFDALGFLSNLHTPGVGDNKGEHSVIVRWLADHWVMTANSKMVIRQPANAVKNLTTDELSRAIGKQPFIKDDDRFAAWVQTTFRERKTTVQDWFSIDAYEQRFASLLDTPDSSATPKDILKLLSCGTDFLKSLANVPGIAVAKDKNTQFLHFIFDGGQGFISQQNIWSKT